MSEENNSYDHIRKVFHEHTDKLSRQITHIEIKQQQLSNYIVTLEAANSQLDRMIRQEQDGQKRAKYYHAQKSNLELLNDVFMTYAKYEDIKAKYYKDTSDLMFKEQHLIEVQIRSLDDKSDRYSSSDIAVTLDAIINGFKANNTSGNNIADIILPELDEDMQYKL